VTLRLRDAEVPAVDDWILRDVAEAAAAAAR
jgi:hypothetical protein